MSVAPSLEVPPLSPFIQGTSIQFAWDSTSLELFKRCPRLYYYVMIAGWSTRGEAIHLRFGIEYHQALQDYETFRRAEMNHDEAVVAVTKELMLRTRDWDPDPRTASEEKKSKRNLVRAVIWYLDKFKDDVAKTIILENGQPGLEVSFRFELDWGATVNDVDHPYILCGHLDRIVEYQGELFVMDRKTASSGLTQYYFEQYHPHNQMTLYSLAGKVILETPVRGVIIDAVNIGEQPEFQRGLTYRTQDQLDEWLYDLTFTFSHAEDYAGEGYWPMNDTACDKYGGCKFRDICQKSPSMRDKFLASGQTFVQLSQEDIWNPLKPR